MEEQLVEQNWAFMTDPLACVSLFNSLHLEVGDGKKRLVL
jgi:hypothetical protein